jgi:sirohydrochlorin ferrochelatase
MAAPALVALAHGSRDPRSTKTITALVAEVKAMRPDLRVEKAFLDLAKPSFQTVVDRLVKAGYDEIVVVPLLLSEAFHSAVDVPDAVAEATSRHPGLQVRVTSILGLEACFLEVLDERLREALRSSRVRELDALVLAAAGSTDPLANQAVARLARRTPPAPRRPPARPCAPSARRAAATSRSRRSSSHRGSWSTVPRSWPSRPAPSPSPSPSAPTPRSPAPSSPVTPSAPSSSSRSDHLHPADPSETF